MSHVHSPLRRGRRRENGMSLVELMVGIAVGMIVVSGAALLAASQITDNRRLVAEMQVLQDLRATADIVTRELRRAGAQLSPESVVWAPGHDGIDPGIGDNVIVSSAGSTKTIAFRYSRSGTTIGALGFRSTGGKIQTRMPALAGTYQDLTDTRTMTVNTLTISSNLALEPTPTAPSLAGVPCPKLCADGSTDCWPRVRVREYTIGLTGTSTLDPSITRSLSTTVKVRADEMVIVPGNPICPV